MKLCVLVLAIGAVIVVIVFQKIYKPVTSSYSMTCRDIDIGKRNHEAVSRCYNPEVVCYLGYGTMSCASLR